MGLAITGWLTQQVCTFPGYLSPSNNLKFSDLMGDPVVAMYKVPIAGWVQIIALSGLIEAFNLQDPSKTAGDIAPPDFPYIARYSDPEVRKDKLNKELNNGRLAMMGIVGAWASQAVTGQTTLEQWGANNLSPF